MKKIGLKKGWPVNANGSNVRSIFYLALCLYSGIFCTDTAKQASPSLLQTCNKEVWLNIFIHGIISIRPHITVTNFIRFLTDDVCESVYGQTVKSMRADPFFYQNQAMQKPGLVPINPNNHQPGAAASALANIFADVNKLNEPQPTQQFFYTFGWSGLLSRSARYADAKELLLSLNQAIAQFRAQGILPKIRILGYSHGGTLGMMLALVKRNEGIMPNFSVDQLLLFGTPIQQDTDYLIADPLFKKIYNIFSRADRVQKLDFFGSGEFFSERMFKPHCGFEQLPEKLIQLEIKLIRKKGEGSMPIRHTDGCRPLLYDGKCCCRHIRNVSPGHMELWFWGWTPSHYRNTFPLYPLPVIAVVPFILNAIRPFEQNFSPLKPVTVTVDPRRDSMVINTNLLCPHTYCLPFLGIQNFLRLKQEALSYMPDPALFNKCTYGEHINRAFGQAYGILKEKKCKK